MLDWVSGDCRPGAAGAVLGLGGGLSAGRGDGGGQGQMGGRAGCLLPESGKVLTRWAAPSRSQWVPALPVTGVVLAFLV